MNGVDCSRGLFLQYTCRSSLIFWIICAVLWSAVLKQNFDLVMRLSWYVRFHQLQVLGTVLMAATGLHLTIGYYAYDHPPYLLFFSTYFIPNV